MDDKRERQREEILAALDVAEASLARGEGRAINEQSVKALAEAIKARGRERVASERSTQLPPQGGKLR